MLRPVLRLRHGRVLQGVLPVVKVLAAAGSLRQGIAQTALPMHRFAAFPLGLGRCRYAAILRFFSGL